MPPSKACTTDTRIGRCPLSLLSQAFLDWTDYEPFNEPLLDDPSVIVDYRFSRGVDKEGRIVWKVLFTPPPPFEEEGKAPELPGEEEARTLTFAPAAPEKE